MTRRRRLVVAASLLATAAGVGWWLLRPTELDRVRAALDAVEPGWRLADRWPTRLAGQPADGDTAADTAAAAGRLVPYAFPQWESRGPVWWRKRPTPGPPADPDGDAVWKTAAEAVAIARRAEHQPLGVPRPDLFADPFTRVTAVQYRAAARSVVRLLRVDAVRVAPTDPAAVVSDLRAMLAVVRVVGREPDGFHHALRLHLLESVADAVVRVLAVAELPADRLTVLHAELAAAIDPTWVADALRDQRAMADAELAALDGMGYSQALAINQTVAGRWPITGRLTFRQMLTRDAAAVLPDLTRLVALAERPVADWPTADQLPLPDDARTPNAAGEGQTGRQLLLQAARLQPMLRAAVVAVGCERFRLRHGRWPDALAELPADLLPADPLSPPVRIERRPDGVVVAWDAGPAALPRRWQLWDVAARHPVEKP